MQVWVAYRREEAVAAIITLRFGETMTYKYGCSDSQYQNLGGLQLLFWSAIEQAIAGGLKEFDWGRSELDNDGLVTFKDRWGAMRSFLTYWSASPARPALQLWRHPLIQSSASHVFARLPDSLLTLTGRLFYKHVG